MRSHRYADIILRDGAVRFDPGVWTPDASVFDIHTVSLGATPVHAGGRQAAWYVRGPFGEGLLRHYHRGGFIARFNRDRYAWTGSERTRSFAEFALLDFMHKRGLRVPEPLAAAYWRCGPTYRAAILMARLPNVQPLAHKLDHESAQEVARAIFAMHGAGVWHADLNAFNILLGEHGTVWLVDFDRGRRLTLKPRHRNANLRRLRRSLVKVAGAGGARYWEHLNAVYQDLLANRSVL